MKLVIWVIFFILILVNITVFIHGISISDDINRFERELKTLHQENLNLATKTNELGSLRYAETQATDRGFVKQFEPYYLESLTYAKK